MRRLGFGGVTAIWLALRTGCATLPDTEFLSDRYVAQSAQFENAWGPLSRYRRGHITVLDRRGLKAASCACYQADRDAYVRILG